MLNVRQEFIPIAIPIVEVAEALLHAMSADVLFLDAETLEGVPYMVASFLATFPRAFHKQVVQLLCKCILPVIAGAQRNPCPPALSCASLTSPAPPRGPDPAPAPAPPPTRYLSVLLVLRPLLSLTRSLTLSTRCPTRTPFLTPSHSILGASVEYARTGFDVGERSLYVQESFAAILSTVFQHVRKPGARPPARLTALPVSFSAFTA